MLQIDLDLEPQWGNEAHWQALAHRAISAAFAQTPFGDMLHANFTLALSVSLSTDAEVQVLNAQYRQKDKPTNVLSFPMVEAADLPFLSNTDDGEVLIGDLILAHETCAREAAEKGVSFDDHATHLIVHGTLHLLGYDHEVSDAEAEAMEALEIKALASLGVLDPYQDQA